MAADWKTVPFSHLAELVRDTVHPAEAGNVVYVGLEHIGERTLQLIGHGVASDATSVKTRFREGDILFGKLRPYFRKVVRAPFDGICSTDIWVVRPREGVDAGYLFYLMASDLFVEPLVRASEGTRMPRAKWEYAASLQLPLPPPPEQRAIARILGTLDDKIELNRCMAQTLEEMARALFRAWFVDFEPVRAKMDGRWRRGESLPGLPADLYDLFPDRLVDSELGEIPEGWRVGRFGDVVEQLRDQENPLSSPDAVFHHFSIPAFDEGRTPKRECGENIKSLKWRVPAGVILLSKLNPEIERVWMVDVRPGERALCSTEFLVLRPVPPFTPSYVYCLAMSRAFRRQIEGLVTGTSKSHQRAQADSILSLAVVLPSSPIVTAFDRSTESQLARTLDCRRESRTLAALRDALLPKLISGELRVTNRQRFSAE